MLKQAMQIMVNFSKYFPLQSFRLGCLICACTLAITACTGSSGSGADNTDSEINQAEVTPSDVLTVEEQSAADDNTIVSDADDLVVDSNPDEVIAEVIALEPVQASLEFVQDKTFHITWQPTPGAQNYRVFENPDAISGFTDISGELDASTTGVDHRVALYSRVNAQYLVQSCNERGCVDSEPVMVTGSLDGAIGYFKASNTGRGDEFGSAVALSADGNTMAVGAMDEGSGSTGVNGDQGNDADTSVENRFGQSGAVYVFVRAGGFWQQQAYIKASNTGGGDEFGGALSLSADGNTMVVGAGSEESSGTGINGDQDNDLASRSGAVYVFERDGEIWQQQAYVKASNTEEIDGFGLAVSLSSDGNTLAVGAVAEDSAATGINGNQNDNSLAAAGAVYVFSRNRELWQQQAYVKASSPKMFGNFGRSVSLNADGKTMAVAADAVHVFALVDDLWTQQAVLEVSGTSVTLSADGDTLAVGGYTESSRVAGINGDPNDDTDAVEVGAVYVFIRNSEFWQQQAFVKASNAEEFDRFGFAISLSADGNTMAVGAVGEDSAAVGINGDQGNTVPPASGGGTLLGAGAVYVFVRNDELWQQQAYVKASNTSGGRTVGTQNVSTTVFDGFGFAVGLSADGETLAIGAINEESAATGINGDQQDDPVSSAGAVYVY